jgi:hypothetical protein
LHKHAQLIGRLRFLRRLVIICDICEHVFCIDWYMLHGQDEKTVWFWTKRDKHTKQERLWRILFSDNNQHLKSQALVWTEMCKRINTIYKLQVHKPQKVLLLITINVSWCYNSEIAVYFSSNCSETTFDWNKLFGIIENFRMCVLILEQPSLTNFRERVRASRGKYETTSHGDQYLYLPGDLTMVSLRKSPL